MAKKKNGKKFDWGMFFLTTAAGAAVSGVVAYTVASYMQKRSDEKSAIAALTAAQQKSSS